MFASLLVNLLVIVRFTTPLSGGTLSWAVSRGAEELGNCKLEAAIEIMADTVESLETYRGRSIYYQICGSLLTSLGPASPVKATDTDSLMSSIHRHPGRGKVLADEEPLRTVSRLVKVVPVVRNAGQFST